MPGTPDRAALGGFSREPSSHTYEEAAEGAQRGGKGEERHRMERLWDQQECSCVTERWIPVEVCRGWRERIHGSPSYLQPRCHLYHPIIPPLSSLPQPQPSSTHLLHTHGGLAAPHPPRSHLAVLRAPRPLRQACRMHTPPKLHTLTCHPKMERGSEIAETDPFPSSFLECVVVFYVPLHPQNNSYLVFVLH